jgi:lysophospholipase L1-like esterase
VLPAHAFPWRPNINPVEKIEALNTMLKAYAAKNGIVYLDYYTAMVDDRRGLPAKLSEDGVHPNLEGYKLMAKHAEKAIAAALKKHQ